jgi:hypothetical protein
MITRFVPVLLLASSLLALLPVAAAPPTVQLIVPSYDYTPLPVEATLGMGIANNRAIVGTYIYGKQYGYLRRPNGHFSSPIDVQRAIETIASGINNAGVVCETFDEGGPHHGFFFDGSTYTQFDLPGYASTYVTGENDAGDFVGYVDDGNGVVTGFVSIGGVITTFTVPGNTYVFPQAINNLGEIAGYYGDLPPHGFFRDAAGALTYPIDYPGAKDTHIYGLNDGGLMVGDYGTLSFERFAMVVQNLKHFVSYDYPDESEHATLFRGVNNSNLISGFYANSDGSATHAFIAHFGR